MRTGVGRAVQKVAIVFWGGGGWGGFKKSIQVIIHLEIQRAKNTK